MRCIIVDDEVPAREELKYLLERHPNVEIIAEADNATAAFSLIEKLKPDIIFLDIHMRGTSGLDLAKELLPLPYCPLIVFVTAYDEYAIKAFEINAIDYLLKPLNSNRVHNTVNRLQRLLDSHAKETRHDLEDLLKHISHLKSSSKMCVYSNGKYLPIAFQDIVYIKAGERNAIIKSKQGDFISSLNLSELEDRLKEYPFFRSHRSFLINLEEILEIDTWFHGTYQITMKGYPQEKIPVSRSNAHKFKQIMNLE